MIRRINLLSGPGAGKSTTAAWLFWKMKVDNYRVEHVAEYVKAWAHMERPPSGFDQMYIWAKQLHKEDVVLKDKSTTDKNIDHIVTECPIFLSICYSALFGVPGADHLAEICAAFEKEYPSLNLFLNRNDKEYKPEGRFQKDVDEAKKIDDIILEKLAAHSIPYLTVDYGDLEGIKKTVYDEIEISKSKVPLGEKESILPQEPTLLDFWAPWCGPCKMVTPILDAISAERSDVKIRKVNVDEDQEMAKALGIRSIPTLVLAKDGKEIDRLVGAQSKANINEWLTENLA